MAGMKKQGTRDEVPDYLCDMQNVLWLLWVGMKTSRVPGWPAADMYLET